MLQRWAVAFGKFWWDFLVGDTPEVLIGALAVIGVAIGLRHDRVAAIVVVPALTIVVLLASTWRGRQRA